jgi:DNA-binding CsgD family transcriptional regulator
MTGILDKVLSELVSEFQGLCKDNPGLSHLDIVRTLQPSMEEQPVYILISDIVAFKPAYLNKACRDFAGIKDQEMGKLDNRFYYKYVHSDSIQIVPQGVSHFSNQPHLPYYVCYKIALNDKCCRWIYIATYTLSFTLENPTNLEYMISAFIDITQIMEEQKSLQSENHQREMMLLKQLTSREMEIIKHFGNELSIAEISQLMNITSNTVKTYRQKIMTKLGIKSGIGLGRYSMLTELL